MSMFDTYRKKLEAQLHEQKKNLDSLRLKARRLAVEKNWIGEKQLAEADKHLAQAKAKFNTFKNASGSALHDLKEGLKTAMVDLQSSSKKAAHHFDSHHTNRRRRHMAVKAKVKAKASRVVSKVKSSKPVKQASRKAQQIKTKIKAKVKRAKASLKKSQKK